MSTPSYGLLLGCTLLPSFFATAGQYSAPPLMLAQEYQDTINPSGYLISEKLDGIRAYWDGHKLLTRSGNLIHTPAWFTKGFPNTPLDGELWLGRKNFESLTSLLHTTAPQSLLWHQVRFVVFDLPQLELPFEQRYQALSNLIQTHNLPHLTAVQQFEVKDHAELMARLEEMTRQGAEGLMLRHKKSHYEEKRSKKLLKLKQWQDAEGIVVGYQDGKGQFAGQLGALWLLSEKGQVFKIGIGFSLEQRKTPPPIGAIVTYKYQGLTSNGKPRFASFLRTRPAE